ncbi:MAG: 30S ribosomal protein S14, small subunit ribosomal protein S14 [Candidatus Peregrinibacteria bacterium GW2011_GWF2_33_10]|nr:MAG: 30S ribosomal protein S14, small subunit ribosomal protein S14 [Candidatus Peregrinibacteria bacterium GW2011_GWF2_33_10]OGJ46124.1 MAG: hypothetical protein A2272_05370 [Candidatus Peregrinibacteria bacterium RIFOXYA12_FULL_33_12]OGJ46170.1 MAG: hypothetical protein A2263_04755 [Candidatus Peregrinibacteria bacterium RIFOXYA2_FULL_33_21]OGJ51587.1 MAG: hypothetical protein A2307_03925 [Candidatus Peregrinibacteria bacterium RIFOXYB2_FULL_33_20]
MARKAQIIRTDNLQKSLEKSLTVNKKMPFGVRAYNRCHQCHRVGGYMRRFKLCRICFRLLASRGEVPGVKKSSW